MKKFFRFILIFLTLLDNSTLAADKLIEFTDPQLEARYYRLIDEIRCLVCQNQSLADSNADLAQDLRYQIYQMIVADKQDKQIHQFLVERYGDFVLYRPPLQKNTWLLWFAPFLLLLISVAITIILIKKQSSKGAIEMSEEEQHRLSAIDNNSTAGKN